MKTFEEAIKLVACMGSTTEEANRYAAEIDERARKYMSIKDDAARSPEVDRMIFMFMMLVNTDEMTPASAMFSLFMNGVVVGMEMEKQDGF